MNGSRIGFLRGGPSQRVSASFAVGMGARLSLAASTALAAILVTRLLTVEEVGQWFFVISMSNLSATLAIAGVPGITVRRLADDSLDSSSVIRSATRITAVNAVIVLGLLLGPIGYLFVRYVDAVPSWRIPLLIAVLFVTQLVQALMSEVSRGLHELNISAALTGAWSRPASVACFLGLALFAEDVSLTAVVAADALATLATMSIIAPFLVQRVTSRRSGNRDGRFGFTDTRLLAAQNLSTQIVAQGDLVIAGIVLVAVDVSSYGVALRLVTLVILPLQVVNRVITPIAARAFARRQTAELQLTITHLMRTIGAISTIIALAYVVFGGPILGLLFGDAYRDAWAILVILAVGQLFNVLTGPSAQLLIAAGRDGVVARTGTISAIVLVAGCIAGGLTAGPVGIAVASSFASALQNGLNWYAVRRHLDIRPGALAPRQPIEPNADPA